jgi:secreted trypsin-like serine protease
MVPTVRKLGVLGLLGLLVMAAPAGAITNGQPDGGRHPEVGALVGFFAPAGTSIAYCSGTLISPTVFLTAAHCGFLGTTVQVTFDETYTPASSTTYSGTFYAHPDYRPGTNAQGQNSFDIAVVVFDQPVTGITPAQLPTAGLLDQMKADGTLNQGTRFTSVGYGDSEFVNGPGGQTTTHLQARHYAVGAYNSLTAAFLHLTQNSGNGGTCNGDSGGPNYLGAGAGETSIIVGITVTGDTHCKSTNVDFRLDTPTARDFLDDYVVLP